MNEFSPEEIDRWEELETTRLLFGLNDAEQAEYDASSAGRNLEEYSDLSRAAAGLDVAWSSSNAEWLPEELRQAAKLHAEAIFAAKGKSAARWEPDRKTGGFRRSLPWWVAAACLALAVWMGVDRGEEVVAVDAAEQRETLLEEADDVVLAAWSPGPTPIEGASGDVAWSHKRQQGFMRFQGLPVNAPETAQYQLWIFDAEQSDKTPIDGGVFNVLQSGEVVVPIDAKLTVQKAVMFAVTIEKSGGVVVSSRERLPLLAKVE